MYSEREFNGDTFPVERYGFLSFRSREIKFGRERRAQDGEHDTYFR